jgi:hypothetical protein
LGRPLPGPAEPTPVPGTPTPVGWVKHETPRLILWLPAEWETLEVNRGDLRELFKEFQERNPELAGIIGSAEALEGVFLWAFDTQSGDPAANNLNVRRTELGGVTAADIPSIVAGAVGQYRQLGIEVQSFESDLEIGGRPATSPISCRLSAGMGSRSRPRGTSTWWRPATTCGSSATPSRPSSQPG